MIEVHGYHNNPRIPRKITTIELEQNGIGRHIDWLKVVEERESTGELTEYYGQARKEGRRVSNIHKASSFNVDAMRAIDALQHSWRKNGALEPRHREMVALVTSALNRCHY
jgi:alkylhydroperoxidase family enzyme|tara:strand:- start:4614 stop:4946 length:333 start_codon:yes stop_codon:yes gene_type:complete